MDERLEVIPYSPENFVSRLTRHEHACAAEIRNKVLIVCFAEYFDKLGAQTLVVEPGYIDRHFLEDYAEYYVRCFVHYPHECTRLHFFDRAFEQGAFLDLLAGRDTPLQAAELRDAYLGFLVVKPLPRTVIGRTCLKTYPSGERRFFPITRRYTANLCGLSLEVRDSLAFQEQDTVVAACATSALWSAFQGTGMLFQHPILSPSQITKAATAGDLGNNRVFPTSGLEPHQMARAIRHVGLEPYAVNVLDPDLLRATAYAYLRGRVPSILGLLLLDTNNKTPAELQGRHAVAVTGFSLGYPACRPQGDTHFQLRASRIDQLYVHDDQVGPFARMPFDEQEIETSLGDDQVIRVPTLGTSWRGGGDGAIGTARAVADTLFVPLYHKIRIPFSLVHDQVLELDSILKSFALAAGFLPEPYGFEWDIYLTEVNEFKGELLQAHREPLGGRLAVLSRGMPRFLWRATALAGEEIVLDLLFDATDIEQGNVFWMAVEYDPLFSQFLRQAVRDGLTAQVSARVAPIFRWFEG